MNASRFLVPVLSLVVGAVLVGCNGASGASASGAGGSGSDDGWGQQTHIQDILEAHCSSCHGTSFTSCWNVQSNASSIESAVSSGFMPRGGTIAAPDKAALLHWLRAGAQCSGTRPDGSGGAGGGSIGSGSPPIGYGELGAE